MSIQNEITSSIWHSSRGEGFSTELYHSAKGQTWKKHKYIAIKNGRYIYPKDIAKTKVNKKSTYKSPYDSDNLNITKLEKNEISHEEKGHKARFKTGNDTGQRYSYKRNNDGSITVTNENTEKKYNVPVQNAGNVNGYDFLHRVSEADKTAWNNPDEFEKKLNKYSSYEKHDEKRANNLKKKAERNYSLKHPIKTLKRATIDKGKIFIYRKQLKNDRKMEKQGYEKIGKGKYVKFGN